MQHKDKAYLWDMLEACKDIIEFTKNKVFIDFDNEKMLRFAVERQLLVLGEAANHISENLKKTNPQIPWIEIIGQRNIVAHEYGEILTERIWKVVKEEIPQLFIELGKIFQT